METFARKGKELLNVWETINRIWLTKLNSFGLHQLDFERVDCLQLVWTSLEIASKISITASEALNP